MRFEELECVEDVSEQPKCPKCDRTIWNGVRPRHDNTCVETDGAGCIRAQLVTASRRLDNWRNRAGVLNTVIGELLNAWDSDADVSRIVEHLRNLYMPRRASEDNE